MGVSLFKLLIRIIIPGALVWHNLNVELVLLSRSQSLTHHFGAHQHARHPTLGQINSSHLETHMTRLSISLRSTIVLRPIEYRRRLAKGELREKTQAAHASFSALPISTSVRGQKWLRSPTGRVMARRISAAIITNVMYQPKQPTTKRSAPPACRVADCVRIKGLEWFWEKSQRQRTSKKTTQETQSMQRLTFCSFRAWS